MFNQTKAILSGEATDCPGTVNSDTNGSVSIQKKTSSMQIIFIIREIGTGESRHLQGIEFISDREGQVEILHGFCCIFQRID